MQRFKDAAPGAEWCLAEIQRCILQTLSYTDIFDYPLTEKEIWKWLICSIPLTSFKNPLKSFKEGLSGLVKKGRITIKNGFYSLPGKEKIIVVRTERAKWSSEKLKIAQKIAKKLENFPWIKMIGITGALAMNNCQEDDDIDLIIITSQNRLWLTRLMVLILSSYTGIKRRKPKDKNPKDKICFNLFLDENHLSVEPKNLFIAHEICQIVPLVNKDKTYERFLWENRWVGEYLPNAVNISSEHEAQSTKGKNYLISQYLSILISTLEKIAYRLQYFYMKPKITNEKVSLHQAFFHPALLGEKTEEEFKLRLKKCNISND